MNFKDDILYKIDDVPVYMFFIFVWIIPVLITGSHYIYKINVISLMGLFLFYCIIFIINIIMFDIIGRKEGFEDKHDMILMFLIIIILGYYFLITIVSWLFVAKPLKEKWKNLDIPERYKGDE